MTIVSATLLGIIEGVTEFLPISSTGHLMLASAIAQLPTTELQKTFDIVIQLGAILAVVILQGRTVLRSPRLILVGIVGFVPTAIIGFALHTIVRTVFLESIRLVGWSLFIGGIALLAFEWYQHRTAQQANAPLSLGRAAAIGTAQSLALVPGVSRSAAAIVGGMLLGLSRRDAVQFSFILAVPTMLAATILDLVTAAPSLSHDDMLMLATGFVAALATALVVIRWLLRFVEGHGFTVFGWYRVLVGIAVLVWWR